MSITVRVGGVVLGALYERPDGSIVRTYHWDGTEKTVSYVDETLKNSRCVNLEEFSTWQLRNDLYDFPNPTDPLLPYDFDLCWDIQYTSQLKRALQYDHPDKDEILEMMVIHNITIQQIMSYVENDID